MVPARCQKYYGHASKNPVAAIHLETYHPCFWEANAGSMRDLFGWNDAQWQQIYLPTMSSWLCWNYGSLCHMPRGCQWGKWEVPMFTKSGGFTGVLSRTSTGNHIYVPATPNWATVAQYLDNESLSMQECICLSISQIVLPPLKQLTTL